ncbi:MAG: hypothetical protein LW809_04880 [Vampirovibrionales bacterium]|jgi:hypothetical protein|nr:hypothetical protein [Vampirovibrionales bacterium]
MFSPVSSNVVSLSSRPQIWLPEQRLGNQKKSSQVQKPMARQLQPKASHVVRVSKSPAGDSFQSSRPASSQSKVAGKITEQSASDIPTEAFTSLGASMVNIFGIQV